MVQSKNIKTETRVEEKRKEHEEGLRGEDLSFLYGFVKMTTTGVSKIKISNGFLLH